MAIVGTIVAAASLGFSIYANEQARSDAKDARREQEKAQAEQRAQNASSSAEERRKQVREERIRRARILQASSNTGTAESSGEIGALGSLSTQLSTNIGLSTMAQQRANNISIFNQNASDSLFSAQEWQNNARTVSEVAGFASDLSFELRKPKKQ